ncbi:unnamed protein product [Candidula unifasciata]|uniref:Major facilitator superfamily (MFS) profile domain-containing protein n=1 Tax=Candidula unifasciata TaxID=100452 RepID=A0A8S3ZAK2_9EUPU|nr:unnamed protein product [Candidula unifasciata]
MIYINMSLCEKCTSFIPPLFWSCRLILSVVSCLGFVCMYSLRFNVVVAMACMVDDIEQGHLDADGGTGSIIRPRRCKGKENLISTVENVTAASSQYTWDKNIQTAVTGSFFWGYWLTMIPGGWYGGKRFIGWSTFGCGIATLFIPLAAHISYRALIFIRILLGVFQGVTWPAMYVIWSQWAPPLERQKLLALCFSGSTFGVVLTYPAVSLLCNFHEEGWTYAFYITGAVTIMWCFLWHYSVYDSPSEHPRISKVEKMYIHNSLKKEMPKETHITPWMDILTSSAVWAYMTAHMTLTFHFFALISLSTIYFQDIHYFSKEEAARTVALSYIGFFACCNISAALYDMAVARKICSRTAIRKTGNSIAFLVPAALLIFVGFLDCNQSSLAVVTMVAINAISGNQFGAGYFVNLLEIAPQHTGVIYGIANMIATFSALASLAMIKELTSNRLRSGWQLTFLVFSAVFVLSSVMFIIFGSGELQEWAKTQEGSKTSITVPRTSNDDKDEIIKKSNCSASV